MIEETKRNILDVSQQIKGITPSEIIRQAIRHMWIQLFRTYQSTSKDMTLNDDDYDMYIVYYSPLNFLEIIL